MRFVFSLSLLFFSLSFSSSVSAEKTKKVKHLVSAKKAVHLKPKKNELVWLFASSLFQEHFQLVSDMLLFEGRESFSKPTVQLRVQWNAASVLRLLKAYHYYLGALRKHFPQHLQAWKQIKHDIKMLRQIASSMRNDALQGTKSKAWLASLKKLKKRTSRQHFFSTVPSNMSTKQRLFLLEVISGFGAGFEMLAYFRLEQFSLLKTRRLSKTFFSKNPSFRSFLSKVGLVQARYRQLKKAFPSEKWIPLYLYHAALLLRSGQLLRSKGRKKLSSFLKRKKELKLSLNRANSSFKHIWRIR